MTAVYTSSAYDSLPMFSDAGTRFESRGGEQLVEKFRSLFTQYKTERTFGLVLNHRHFDMSPNERLVEYRGTSVPWEGMLDRVQPITWLLSSSGECLPYEFHYVPNADANNNIELPSNAKYEAFVRDFNELLRQEDALGLFGLCSYAGDDFEGRVEITEGRANINLHPDDAPEYMASRAAAWFFSPNLLGKCVCVCGGNGHTTATHKGHVASR